MIVNSCLKANKNVAYFWALSCTFLSACQSFSMRQKCSSHIAALGTKLQGEGDRGALLILQQYWKLRMLVEIFLLLVASKEYLIHFLIWEMPFMLRNAFSSAPQSLSQCAVYVCVHTVHPDKFLLIFVHSGRAYVRYFFALTVVGLKRQLKWTSNRKRCN